MLKQRPIQLIMTILPLVVLLILSGYLTIITFNKYRTHKTFKHTLENVELLEAYETAVLNESLCKSLLPKGSKKVSSICKESIDKSTILKKEIQNRDENLNHWEQKIVSLRKNILKYPIDNFEHILSRETIEPTLHTYLNKVELNSNDMEEIELLKLYARLSKIGYTTELEQFLLQYYLSKKTPVSTLNMIFWDKIVESSDLLNFENELSSPLLKEELLKILSDDKLQTTLNKINDMRFTVLTGKMLDDSKNVSWSALLEKKKASIDAMKSIIHNRLKAKNQHSLDAALWALVFYLSILILALLSLVYSYYKIKKEKSENSALLSVVHRINALSGYGTTESDVTNQMLEEAQSKEDIFAYIYSSFHLLYEKSKQISKEAETKSEVLSTLSHEIRTPLNGIIGFTKLLKDMGTTDDQSEFLSLIESASHKLIMIVNDILDLSKIDADKMELENVSFDIYEMVESTATTFTQEMDQKDIEFGMFVDPFLPHYFLGDSTKLSQILTNLIGNAVKFTEPYGKINIFVQSMRNSDDECKIKFAVNDTGIGLSDEQIKNIFNAFSQATVSTSNKYGGTGLGLTISRKMVELMGGKLEVESKINEGATFYFTLILKKDTERMVEATQNFSGTTIGLALPVKNIKRQQDMNLEIYMRHLGAKFSIYYYEDLFESYKIIDLPDIMVFDHHYARLSGELDQCTSLDCKTVLLSNGILRSRITPEHREAFADIILTPISFKKCIRILDAIHNVEEKENYSEKTLEEVVYEKQTTALENIESFVGLKALVADDNLINRKLIKIILEKLGLNVFIVSNGQEVCEAYQEGSYDIVFMDIQMPVMDGVEATRCILEYESKNDISHVPIIALTANVGTGDKERYLDAGMDDYTTKPVEIDTIKSMILKYCHSEFRVKSETIEETNTDYSIEI